MNTTVDVKSEKKKAWKPSLEDVVKQKLWYVLSPIWMVLIYLIYRVQFRWWWNEWWRDESYYSHGILIPVISGFIIWFNWNRIKRVEVRPSIWGLFIMLPMLFLNYKSQASGLPSVGGLTFPVMMAGLALVIFGKKVLKELCFPFLFLYFMTVPPTSILEPLSFRIQMISTTLATTGLNLLGLHSIQTGTQIQLPSGLPVVVGAPCSGFRLLISFFAFAAFLAFIKEGPKWGKAAMVAFVLPLSLLANSIRVLMISLVGEYYGSDMMHTFHDYAGYIILVVSLAIMFLFAKVVKCKDFKSMP